jgi:ADP-heptose:LPS heptosyltransferase
MVAPQHYRDNTALKPMELAFIYNRGGLGDYIHWTTAIQCAIDSNPQISGLVSSPPYFAELAEYWLRPWSDRFQIHIHNESKIGEDPILTKMKRRFHSRFDSLNSCVHHLMFVGFGVYAYLDYIPEEWNRLPEIRGDERNISRFELPPQYAVVTTEATSKTRMLPVDTINAISKYLNIQGIRPVFLGRKELDNNYGTIERKGINTTEVLDLRDQTTSLEAACILANAKLVVGLDNGLLHLACCSKVPVIMAFTTVHPRQRIPPRPADAKTFVIVPPEELKCRFCQTNVHFVEHDFRHCMYKDEACCKLMTADEFIKCINLALKGESNAGT